MTMPNFRSSYRLLACVCGFSLLAFALPLPAGAQDRDARLRRLENEIETLSRAVYKGETPPSGSLAVGENVSQASAANTELRLQQIEMDLRSLTGRVEESDFRAQQFQTQTEQVIAALEARVSMLEAAAASGVPGAVTAPAGAAGYPSYAAPPQPPQGGVSSGLQSLGDAGELTGVGNSGVMPPGAGHVLGTMPAPAQDAAPAAYPEAPPMPANDPAGLYEQAFSYLRDKNYEKAESGFRDFLSRYPQHDLAANAQYWLGESFYVRGDFEQAARAFAEGYQKYPKGSKGADNLLKLGMALAGLGKKQDACLTYAQLKKDYPNGAMPVLARAEQEMDALDCAP